tara:strand:- start:148 stop:525 length:378 start_codon:yes stop_codon:yes gene_type:complete
MEDYKKFTDALSNLKPEAGFCYRGNYPMTEEKYATVEWSTGVEADGETAITTTVNPHSELTWDKVNAEMDRLQAEYDAQDYARKRKEEYPDIYDYMDGIVKDDQTQIDKYISDSQAVKDKYPKGA